MWPLLLDIPKEECRRMLRPIELEAYSQVITAFRAQGDLTKEKKKVLQDLCTIMSIPVERHKAEVRRAVNDERLCTIAYQLYNCSVSSEWATEGRRLVPLMPRLVPQTAFTVLADRAAEVLATQNALLPMPAATTSKREPSFSSPALTMDASTAKSVEPIPKSVGSTSAQDVLKTERDTPHAATPMPTPDEIFAQQIRYLPLRSGTTRESATSRAPGGSQAATSEMAVASVGPSGNVAIPARTPIGVLREGDRGRRYRRSSTADTQAATADQKAAQHQVPNPHPQGALAKSGALPPPPARSLGGAPMQFALPTSSPKMSTTSTASGPPQKVILLSTPGSNLPSSLLQRSLGLPVPVVKTVTTGGSTLSATQPTGGKSTAHVTPSSATTATSASNSAASSPLDGSTFPPSFPTPVPPTTNTTTTIGSGVTARPVATAATSAVKMTPLQGSKAQVQNAKGGPKRILVPVTTQSPTTSQTVQIKASAGMVKPSSIHFKPEGQKFITQSLPLPAGAKLIPKSIGGSGPPIVVVTKSALTQSSQSATRLVNVLTTQASTGKLMAPTTLTMSKASGTPTFVSVGPKGKHAALVKMSPAMSLPGSGGKPNVIVVQKAHLMSHTTSGNTITVSASSLSAAAQTVLKTTSGTTLTYEDKVPKQSTVLADILQAAGIIGDTATAEAVSVETVVSQPPKISAGLPPPPQTPSEVPTRVPPVTGCKSGNSTTPVPPKSEPKPPVMVNPSSAKGSSRSPSVNLQQINLPFDIEDAQIVEMQDSHGLVSDAGKLSAETLNLFQQSGLQITSVPVDSTDVKTRVETDVAVEQQMEVVASTSSEPVVLLTNQPQDKLAPATKIEGVIAVQADSTHTVSTVLPPGPNVPVPVLSMPSLATPAPKKVEADRMTKPEESGELDPSTGLFRATGDQLTARKEGGPPVKLDALGTAGSSTNSEVTAQPQQTTTPVCVRPGSTGEATVVAVTKTPVLTYKLTTSTTIGCGIKPTQPKAVVSTANEGIPSQQGSSAAFGVPTTQLAETATAPPTSISVTTTELPLETGPKLPFRLATYSREDSAMRKKPSSSHTTETVVKLPSAEEVGIAFSSSPTPVVPSSGVDEVVGNLVLADAVRELLTEAAPQVTGEEFQQGELVVEPPTDGVGSDPTTSLSAEGPIAEAVGNVTVSEDPDHLLFITASGVELVSDQPLSDLESITTANPIQEYLMVEMPAVEHGEEADGNEDPLTGSNPNVTVEVLPGAPFEFTHHLELAHHLADETPVVESETVEQVPADQLVFVDEVTFADDGMTTGVEETVVTVELDSEMDAVGERRWKWPLSPEPAVPASPGGAGAEGELDAEMQRVLANLERHGGVAVAAAAAASLEQGGLLPADDGVEVMEGTVTNVDAMVEVSEAVGQGFLGGETPSISSAPSGDAGQEALQSTADLLVADSSMFVVTDSAVIEESAEHTFAYDTECAPHPPVDVTAGGADLATADTIVAESATALLGFDVQVVEGEIQTTPVLEGAGFDEQGSSVASTSAEQTDESQQLQPPTMVPGKRKRKHTPIPSPEENLNIPHLSGWARSAMGLLLRVMKFRGARKMKGDLGASHWFLNPVTAEEAPGYHQVIQMPMDFSTIKTRLETLCYHTVSEFHVDMMQVKTNCELYNPPEHEARKDCEEVFHFYVQEYDRLIEKWQKAHLFTSSQKRPKLDVPHETL